MNSCINGTAASKESFPSSEKANYLALLLFVLFSGGSACGQILYYYDDFAGGVTTGGYAPYYAGGGTGTIGLHFPPNATIRTAVLFAGDHHSLAPVTVVLNGKSFTFNDANIVTPGFYSFYGSPAYVHAIDVHSAIDPARAAQTLVVPDQLGTAQRFTDFYLVVTYNVPGHTISRVSMYLDTTKFDRAMILTLPVFRHAKGTADLCLGLYTGYICDQGDAEDIFCNSAKLGNIYGPETNSGTCGGPYANFYYDNGIAHGLGDDNADLQMQHADVLSNIRTLVNPQDSFLNLTMFHTGTANSDNSIWGVILIDGDTGCSEIGALSIDPSSAKFLPLTICSAVDSLAPDSIVEVLTNTGCDPVVITSAAFQADPDFFEQGLTMATIAPHDKIRFTIYLKPKTKGPKKGWVKFTSYSLGDSSTFRRDSIPIDGIVGDGTGILASFPDTMAFGRMTLCTGADSIRGFITNTGCDTAIVDKTTLLGLDYSAVSIGKNIIAPRDTEWFTIFLAPHSKGVKKGSFTINWHSIGGAPESQANVVALEGFAGDDSTDLFSYPSDIALKGFTVCSGVDSVEGFITNIGCDTLVTEGAFILDQDFSIGNFQGRMLLPSDTERFTLYLHPNARGTQKGWLTFTAHHADDTLIKQVHEIPIECTIGDGIRTLVQKPDSIHFGISEFCLSLDTFIVLVNTGCDTLRIDSALLAGSGFSLGNMNFPLEIPPGDSIRIPLKTLADKGTGVSTAMATLTIKGNADNALAPLAISRGYRYGQNYSLYFDPPQQTATAGETVGFILRTDADLLGVRTIDFDLGKKSEILTYLNTAHANTITCTGGHVQIAGSPFIGIDNGAIDTFRFAVRLAKDSTDGLVISHVVINSVDSTLSPCSSITSVSGANFLYHYLCGDLTIQNYLNGILPLRIIGIHPNPATQEIAVGFYSAQTGEISLSIFDAIGSPRLNRNIVTHVGEQQILLDIGTLPSGIYTLELSGSSGKQLTHFIKLQ